MCDIEAPLERVLILFESVLPVFFVFEKRKVRSLGSTRTFVNGGKRAQAVPPEIWIASTVFSTRVH